MILEGNQAHMPLVIVSLQDPDNTVIGVFQVSTDGTVKEIKGE
jgi:hypothetical protein